MSKTNTNSDVEAEAEKVLLKHGLFKVPIDPVVLAQKEGIQVFNAKFSEDSLSGMITKRGENISILINQSDAPYRKRFTIAHELGHRFLHLESDGEFVDSEVDLFRDSETGGTVENYKLEEVQANRFAAALLIPKKLLVEKIETTTRNLSELAQIFNVSEEAMGIRLNKLRLL